MLPTQPTRRKERKRARRWLKLVTLISHHLSTLRSTSYSTSRTCCLIRLLCKQIRLFPCIKILLSSRQRNSSRKVLNRQLIVTSVRTRLNISANSQTTLRHRIIGTLLIWVSVVAGTLVSNSQAQ
jgi:hypothetical protein